MAAQRESIGSTMEFGDSDEDDVQLAYEQTVRANRRNRPNKRTGKSRDCTDTYEGRAPRRLDLLREIAHEVTLGNAFKSKWDFQMHVLEEAEKDGHLLKSLRSTKRRMDIVCKLKGCKFLRVFQVPRGCDGPDGKCTAAVSHTCNPGDFKPTSTQGKSNYTAKHLEGLIKDAVVLAVEGQQGGTHKTKTEFDVPNKVLAVTLKPYLHSEVTPRRAQNVKEFVFKAWVGDAEYWADRIFVLKDLAEEQGFRIEVLLSTQMELKARFIKRCKKDFEKAGGMAVNFDEEQLEYPEQLVDPELKECKFLSGWLLVAPYADHFTKPGLWSVRTEVDAAQTLLDDTLFSRVTADANNRIVTLGMGLFNDTENATTAAKFNKFCADGMPELKSRQHVSVADAAKGGISAHVEVMPAAELFCCSNRGGENCTKSGRVGDGEKYREWATATTTPELDRARGQISRTA
ncbi:hypothetical protein CTAYLR_010672 [Chrysophaeum taylorii]|uniref:Uncharacterized protein n=1 Tax=Chrysophaeum taylorii TaxID=2483200 RepID=A0AAD7XGS4_9STRA|nr:hypothetical protein CTAYLR_010672 [Chrysophaeum taylorii]